MSTCSPNAGFLPASDASMIAKTSAVVWQEICAIQQAILAAANGQSPREFCVDISGDTPFTFYSQIKAVNVVAGGELYGAVPATASVTRTEGEFVMDVDDIFLESSGVDAILKPVVSSTGAITSVQIINPGTAYVLTDVLVFDHPTGTSATASFTVNSVGGIESVTMLTQGNGYTTTITDIVATSSEGSGATFDASVDPVTGAILSVSVVNSGYGYLASDTVVSAVSATGSGAQLSATVSSNVYSTDPHQYYLVWTGSVKNTLISKQLAEVTSYFSNLGYSVKIFENDEVPGRLLWNICWC
jgi:hypothetical protein